MCKRDDPDAGSRLKRLQDLNRKLDEIIRDGDTKLAELRSRVDASATNARFEVLIDLLAKDAESSLTATRENIGLQIEVIRLTRQMKCIVIGALIFAVIACILAAGQLYYASPLGRPSTIIPQTTAAPEPRQ